MINKGDDLPGTGWQVERSPEWGTSCRHSRQEVHIGETREQIAGRYRGKNRAPHREGNTDAYRDL